MKTAFLFVNLGSRRTILKDSQCVPATAVESISNRRIVHGKSKKPKAVCVPMSLKGGGKYAHNVSEILIEEKY